MIDRTATLYRPLSWARWTWLQTLGMVLTGAALVLAGSARAQDELVPLSESELQELVGPIALYPDDVLGVILPASTYPLQIVQAARFLDDRETNPDLAPDDAWDDSVVALLNYPEVVRRMNEDLDWTWSLGEAVLNDQAAVLDAVQGFRNRAYAAGNLSSDDVQTVTESDGVIEIAPADPAVVYIPYYEPERVVVYQPVRAYDYYPYGYPVYYYPYPVGYRFGLGFFWGVTSAFSIGWHTHNLHVYHQTYIGHPYYHSTYYAPYYNRRNVYVTVNVNNDRNVWVPRRSRGARPYDGYRARTASREGRTYDGRRYRYTTEGQSGGARTRGLASDAGQRTVRGQRDGRVTGSPRSGQVRDQRAIAGGSQADRPRRVEGSADNRTTIGGVARRNDRTAGGGDANRPRTALRSADRSSAPSEVRTRRQSQAPSSSREQTSRPPGQATRQRQTGRSTSASRPTQATRPAQVTRQRSQTAQPTQAPSRTTRSGQLALQPSQTARPAQAARQPAQTTRPAQAARQPRSAPSSRGGTNATVLGRSSPPSAPRQSARRSAPASRPAPQYRSGSTSTPSTSSRSSAPSRSSAASRPSASTRSQSSGSRSSGSGRQRGAAAGASRQRGRR